MRHLPMRNMRLAGNLVRIAGAVAVTMSLGSIAAAVDKNWVGSANGLWTVAGSWNPSGMPGTLDTAVFNMGVVAPGYNVIFITTQFQSINAVIDKLRMDSSPITFTAAASTLTMTNSALPDASRALVIGRAGSGTPNAVLTNLLAQLNAPYATLGLDAGSSGTLNMNGGVLNVTGISATWDLTIGLAGAGAINLNNGADANITDDTILGVNPGASGAITINAADSIWTSGGDLFLGGSGSAALTINAGQFTDVNCEMATWTGFGGIVTATITGPNSIWNNTNGLIVGQYGTAAINVSAGGRITGGGTGHLGYFPGAIGTATITGAGSNWTNSGATMIGRGGQGSLTVSGGGLVTNGFGILGLLPGSIGNATITGTNSRWNNSGDVRVGDLGHGSLAINSAGKVMCDDAYIGLQSGSSGQVTVDGAGAEWTIIGDFYIGNAGQGSLTCSNGAWVHATNVFVGLLGEIHGNSTIGGDVQNSGLVSPGMSAGTLTINGDYSQTAAGELLVELASASDSDQLVVDDTALLAGTLTVNLINGFTPSPGQTFTILDAASVAGTFATINAPAGMQVIYTANSVILQAPGTPCPADINHSGAVNVDDLLTVITSWGACPNPCPPHCAADIAPTPAGNCAVNVDDLLMVITHWGACP